MKGYFFIFGLVITISCNSERSENLLLSKDHVDLGEKKGVTIIRNLTGDTLNLSGVMFSPLLFYEEKFASVIAPGLTDTIKFNFAFPDFIQFSPVNYHLLNGPGKTIVCEFSHYSKDSIGATFKGDLADVNEYYLSFHNHFGPAQVANRTFFSVADTLKNFNDFPRLADSINNLSLNFLNNYARPVPDWFKRHESLRLQYRVFALKFNVLMTKEFYSGKKIPVAQSYYNFDKKLSLKAEDMILNTDYLNYGYFYFYHYSLGESWADKMNPGLHLIDSLYGSTEIGDLFKMFQLSNMQLGGSFELYSDAFAKTSFKDEIRRAQYDSLLRKKCGIPVIEKESPNPILVDGDGKLVHLSNFKGDVLLVNFWATWCGPCIQEFVYENKIHKKYAGKGLKVINVCVESSQQKWESVSNEKNLQMVNLFSREEDYLALKRQFGLGALPRSILIDKDFRVKENFYKRASSLTDADIEKLVEEL